MRAVETFGQAEKTLAVDDRDTMARALDEATTATTENALRRFARRM